MKIKEIINIVDKSKQFESHVSINEIANEMNLNIYNYPDQHKLTSYFIGNWYCTDTFVGYKVYFFENEPVAVSYQGGRKMNEEIEWLSKESYKKVRDYVLTFLEEEEEPSIKLADMEEEIGETYKIEYHGQLFDYHKSIALLKGVNVKIIDCHKGQSHNAKKQYEPSLVKIQLKDNTEKWIEVGKLDFPYNLKNN